MLIREILHEGGWDTKITQGTVIHPSTVRHAMKIMSKFISDWNEWLSTKGVEPIKLGHPTGSSAYHEVDPEDKVYGDIDLQIIVPDLQNHTTSQAQGHWYRLEDEFVKLFKPSYVHPDSEPGHPIIQIGQDSWVQIDLMPHPERLATWGRFRTTPERGIKGLLNGNMFSVLGEMLRMSIQHSGVQYKVRDGEKQPYSTTRKNYELVTLTTDIENFVREIFNHEYTSIIGSDIDKAKIDRLLLQHPGSDINQVKIANLVNAVKGLARSFALNKMYGKGDLSHYTSAEDFLQQFWTLYEAKAMKDITAGKRDKAETPEAKARAEEDKIKILSGLATVKQLFNVG